MRPVTSSERVLDSPPSLLPLFARSAAALIPGTSRLPFIGGGGGREIPELTLTLPSVRVERERLVAYDRVCGFSLSDTLPPTYIHILAFPLHLKLMSERSFPFRAIGLVHIANKISQHRHVNAAEELSLRVVPTALEPHPRGRQFSLRTEARVGEELVWEEVSTILKRGAGSAGPSGPVARPSTDELPVTATWKLRGDLGRRYASVSGDINPIHMHPLSAKLFGFPSAIAHGMWTKARCLAALEGRLPAAFTVEVSFRRPIVLPAMVGFAQAPASEGGVRFSVRDARKSTPHLAGSAKFG
ncbi:MAG TPA: MaoC/PaaZ C-terminal domain-containing protein [Solirubrobacteraceae bacterium]|nr:MaoC/PaaZ C-terminal domain-containing protein [Solirubrobacteraceae bacterium]